VGADLPAEIYRHIHANGIGEADDRMKALAAADILNQGVLPFFERQGLPLPRMLKC
jgi:hypothetical protein